MGLGGPDVRVLPDNNAMFRPWLKEANEEHNVKMYVTPRHRSLSYWQRVLDMVVNRSDDMEVVSCVFCGYFNNARGWKQYFHMLVNRMGWLRIQSSDVR